MFTIKLLKNTNSEIAYEIWNADLHKKINEISVNKDTHSYKLRNNKQFSNSYETGAYRAILELINEKRFPEKFSDGWG